MPISIKLPVGGGSGIDTSDATATIDDIALDKTAYVNGNKITGTANITTLNLFSQTTQPSTFDGLWVNTSNNVNKMAQVDDFLSEWNSTFATSMPVAKFDFGSILYDNKIYCIGGTIDSESVVASNYIYNILTNKWTTGTNMPSAKACDAVQYNGKVYCIGGYTDGVVSNSTNYIYNISDNSWATGNPIPVAVRRNGQIAYNGKIYCIGGYTTGARATTYIYDIASNSWSTGANMSVAKFNFGCVQYNGKIYCIGGYLSSGTPTNLIHIYDIKSNSWTTSTTTLPVAKAIFKSVECNGKIYSIGGYNNSVNLSTNYIYDIETNKCTTGTSMPISVRGYGAVCRDGKIYCIGGYASTYIDNVYIYSITTTNISLYNSSTLVLQRNNYFNNYETKLIESSSFIGGFNYPFSDAIINGINADIYYGNGSQWIKIRSAT